LFGYWIELKKILYKSKFLSIYKYKINRASPKLNAQAHNHYHTVSQTRSEPDLTVGFSTAGSRLVSTHQQQRPCVRHVCGDVTERRERGETSERASETGADSMAPRRDRGGGRPRPLHVLHPLPLYTPPSTHPLLPLHSPAFAPHRFLPSLSIDYDGRRRCTGRGTASRSSGEGGERERHECVHPVAHRVVD
jgi:hypothetical protein